GGGGVLGRAGAGEGAGRPAVLERPQPLGATASSEIAVRTPQSCRALYRMNTRSSPACFPPGAREPERSAPAIDRRGLMSRRSLFLTLLAVGVAAAFAAGALAGEGKKNDKHFQYAIGLWGHLPYPDTQALVGVPNLSDDMNNADTEFSVHDGALKAGNGIAGSVTPTTCQTAQEPTIYSQGLGYFNALEKPAVFTPGDNDWTDCDRTSNGGFNGLFQLQYERNLFFKTDRSLGEHTMKLE